MAPSVSYATIAGGVTNRVGTNSSFSTIGGGSNNTISVNSGASIIAGGSHNDIGTNSGFSTIGGGSDNNVAANSRGAAIAGGLGNNIGTNSSGSAIGGGTIHSIGGYSTNTTIGGGFDNSVGTNCYGSTIGGGSENKITNNSIYATIAGGRDNTLGSNATSSVISGGVLNQIGVNCGLGTIGGGSFNVIGNGANYATIPGGTLNTASADHTFAAGQRAKAIFPGSFVWADSQTVDFNSALPDSVSFRCQGGVRFTSGSGGGNQTVSWLPGSAAWSFSSDRNLKEAVIPVDTREVLEKVSQLPMNEWKFKGHSQRHIGPMAQDFHAQFPLNTNDTMIDSGDLHGVSLAAIQGLNQKLEETRAENTELKARLAALEKLVTALARKGD
jgi:trimeric autotransporter adhesin